MTAPTSAAGARAAAMGEKRKQGEQPRDKKHQPETDEKSRCTLGGLGHTTSLEIAAAGEIGRKYRFVLVVTSSLTGPRIESGGAAICLAGDGALRLRDSWNNSKLAHQP